MIPFGMLPFAIRAHYLGRRGLAVRVAQESPGGVVLQVERGRGREFHRWELVALPVSGQPAWRRTIHQGE